MLAKQRILKKDLAKNPVEKSIAYKQTLTIEKKQWIMRNEKVKPAEQQHRNKNGDQRKTPITRYRINQNTPCNDAVLLLPDGTLPSRPGFSPLRTGPQLRQLKGTDNQEPNRSV